MKHPFLKSILVLGSVLAFVNCGEDNSTTNADPLAIENQNVAPSDPAWQLDAAGQTFLIYTSGIVTDATGAIVGTFVTAEGSETVGNIIGIDGETPILQDVDTSALPVTSLEALNAGTPASSDASATTSSAGGETTLSSANNTTASSSSVANNVTSSANTQQPNSSATTAASSSSQQQQTVVTNGNVTVTGNLNQTVAKKASTSEIKFTGVESVTRMSWNAWWLEPEQEGSTYTIPAATVPEHFDPQQNPVSEFFKVNGVDYELKITISGVATSETKSSSSQQQQQQKSSSSQQQQQKSSSSQQQQKSSSSQQQQKSSSSVAVVTTGCPNLTPKGNSGSGWATRYWDGCKPSCSWKNNAGSAGPARQCSANGKTQNTDYNAKSVCDGGSAAVCTSQIPFTVEGCSNIGFAFAAVPSFASACGHCYELTFTGEGKYETKENHRKLKGKKLVVMATNIGGDVSGGQFDIMIPGGGVGIFNGTAGYGWGNQGNQYGGLLSDCEDQVGGGNDQQVYEKRKQCLTEKCNSVFSSDAEAKKGCLFLADFMEAAGNPLHTYVEVECPEVLKSRY